MHTSTPDNLAALVVASRGSVDDLVEHRVKVIAGNCLVMSIPAKFHREAFVLYFQT